MTAPTIAPAAGEYAPHYAGYIARVPQGDVLVRLRNQIAETAALLRPLDAAKARHRYAPGKWSVIEVLGHLADTERVMAYRALRVARGDETPLAGFDENVYVPAGEFERRPIADVVGEFEAVRAATVALLGGLPAAAWTRWGVANGQRVTVRALAHIIAGHELHHVDVLRSRYGVGAG
ncbi:MAG TPA: DinB family protein [Gemmatimonadales bacterium]